MTSISGHPAMNNASRDEEPRMSAELEAAFKNRGSLSPEQSEELRHYFENHEAWEERMAEKGRGYSADYASSLILKAHKTLVDWLAANNAPEEIQIIAKWIMTAVIIRYKYALDWSAIDNFYAIEAGQLVPAFQRALKGRRSHDRQ